MFVIFSYWASSTKEMKDVRSVKKAVGYRIWKPCIMGRLLVITVESWLHCALWSRRSEIQESPFTNDFLIGLLPTSKCSMWTNSPTSWKVSWTMLSSNSLILELQTVAQMGDCVLQTTAWSSHDWNIMNKWSFSWKSDVCSWPVKSPKLLYSSFQGNGGSQCQNTANWCHCNAPEFSSPVGKFLLWLCLILVVMNGNRNISHRHRCVAVQVLSVFHIDRYCYHDMGKLGRLSLHFSYSLRTICAPSSEAYVLPSLVFIQPSPKWCQAFPSWIRDLQFLWGPSLLRVSLPYHRGGKRRDFGINTDVRSFYKGDGITQNWWIDSYIGVGRSKFWISCQVATCAQNRAGRTRVAWKSVADYSSY